MKYFLILFYLFISCATFSTSAQTSVPLFNDDGLDGWQYQNTETEYFSMKDGVLQVSGNRGWLQSPASYEDFILDGEFRFVEADSDSGIFLRVEPGTDFILGWPGDAYQVQIREISVNTSDNPLPLANLYRHRVENGTTNYAREQVFESYSGVGQWQSIRIIVIGSKLVVELNGETVTTADNLVNASGAIGFQSEKGIIEFRNLMLNEI